MADRAELDQETSPAPGDDTDDQTDQTSSTTIMLWAGLAAVVGLVGMVVLSVVASTVVVFFFTTSQAPCVDALQGQASTGGDSSVPLPAEDPAARLQVSIVSWNTYYKNSTANVVRGFRAIE